MILIYKRLNKSKPYTKRPKKANSYKALLSYKGKSIKKEEENNSLKDFNKVITLEDITVIKRSSSTSNTSFKEESPLLNNSSTKVQIAIRVYLDSLIEGENSRLNLP